MEMSSLPQMEQPKISATNPNPPNPFPNHFPTPINPNLPILPQIQPPGTHSYFPVEPFQASQKFNYQQTTCFSYYQDPNAAFPNVTAVTPGVAVGAYPINHPQTGSTWTKASKKPKVVQSVRCEICNIECNTKDVLEVHITGKKHNKNLLKESASNVPNSAPTPVFAPLASKKSKVVQSIRCEICKIECNTKDILEVHNMGKKHIKNVSKLKESASNVPAYAPTPVSAPFGNESASNVPAYAPTPVSAPFGNKSDSNVPASAPTPVSAPFGNESASNVPAFAPTPVSAPFGNKSDSNVPASAPTPVSAPFGNESASNVPAFAPTPVSAPFGNKSDSNVPASAPTPVSAPFGKEAASSIPAPTPVSALFGKEAASSIPASAPTPVLAPFMKESGSNVLASAPTPVSAPFAKELASNFPASAPSSVSALFAKELASNVPASAPISAPFGIPGPSSASPPTPVSSPFGKELTSNVFAPTPVLAPFGIPGPSSASNLTPVSSPFGKESASNVPAPTPALVPFWIPVPSSASPPTPVSALFEIPRLSPAPTPVSALLEIPGSSLYSAPKAATFTSQCPMIGPQENPNTSSAPNGKKKRKKGGESREDLATKTRKVLQGGANAGAVMTCPVCNVVCNSDTVFRFHLAGQKHATMMKRNAVLTEGAVTI